MDGMRLFWWLSWSVEAVVTGLCLTFAPLIAIVLFALGATHDAWVALAVFGLATVYALVLARDYHERTSAED
jgi:hypothetical protein